MQNEKQQPAPHEVLYRHVREWGHCDVLIDRMAGFPLQDELEALERTRVPQCLLNDPIFAESPAQAPTLVRLPWTETALLEKYLACALQEATDPDIQTRTVCAFLFSTLEQATLARQLTKRLDVPVQTAGSIYFRYFDPRVAGHLPRILGKNQISTLLDGVQAWLYVNWKGQLADITPQPSDTILRFMLTAAQWEEMQCIESFNLALRLLQQSGFPAKEEDDLEPRLLAAVRSAVVKGISASEDQAVFAAYAVRFGEVFTQHLQLTQAIELAAQHDIPLADALAAHTGIPPDISSSHQIFDQRATT